MWRCCVPGAAEEYTKSEIPGLSDRVFKMSNPWKPRTIPAPRTSAEVAESIKQRHIAHYREHGRRNFVMESEVARMKEMGLFREGDELLTVSDYEGVFIVLRGGEIVRVKFGSGNAAIVDAEEAWMQRAKREIIQ